MIGKQPMDCRTLNTLSSMCNSLHFLGNKRGMLIGPQCLVMCCLCEMLGDHRRTALACRGIFIDWEWMYWNRVEVMWILKWQCWWFWRAAGMNGFVMAGDKWALVVQAGLLLPVDLGGEQAPARPCCSPVPVGCRVQGAAPAADVLQLPLWAGYVGAADGKVRNKPFA